MKTLPVLLMMALATPALPGCAANSAETHATSQPAATAPPSATEDKKPATQDTFTGTLHTGIVAIGAETTGVILETAQGTYELDLRGNEAAGAKAESLNGKKVTVIGDYRPRRGVEVKQRRIIVVRDLRAAQ